MKVQITKNYRLFQRHDGENRKLDLGRHKKLVESMRNNGFLQCFPIVVYRNEKGVFIIKDGQHRHAIAEELGLPIAYVEEPSDFDVAEINSTAKVWQLRDYIERHAAKGDPDYAEVLEFSARFGIAIGNAVKMLGGTTVLHNVKDAVFSGNYKVKDREWAHNVASLYSQLAAINKDVKTGRLLEACMAVCRVKSFNAKQLIANATRCRDKLVPYSTRDANLDMIESLYNFNRHKLIGLKAEALNALRSRSPIRSGE
jgi:hypothetical protein